MKLCLRFDIDSEFGLVDRVPPLLDVLDEFGAKATFFCVMGPEAHLGDLVQYRLLSRMPRRKFRVRRRGGVWRTLRSVAFPGRVGCGHADRLRAIRDRGHEVQPHGWKHITWQRGLRHLDVGVELQKIVREYTGIFCTPPLGFASPGRTHTPESMKRLDEAGFLYHGDLDGPAPFRPTGARHWQIPITLFTTIGELFDIGLSGSEVKAHLTGHLYPGRAFACLYNHPEELFERELEVLREILADVRDRGVELPTHIEVLRSIEGVQKASFRTSPS
jgi:peptidoglycan/xylan/chitin deacetylase (PgdA/CDA1 family)